MRLARVATDDGEFPVTWLDGAWAVIDDVFSDGPSRSGLLISAEDCRLLPPVTPRVIVGMAHNGSPTDREQPPQAFLKSARTLAGPGDTVPIDAELGRTVVEGELAIVLRCEAKNLTADRALDAVLGYTVANDVSAADQSAVDSFWTQTKNGVNYSPLGPWIETGIDPLDALIRLRVNGCEVASASTSQLARSVSEVLAYVTRYITLGPGDVIMTGCPGTMFAVNPGDTFEVEIEGIGVLANRAG
jgi:2-keto-4-pentenoate hydratase/2-oxohepta-3-ene-1,7-dioic acid hydratase in catechol pathway